MKGLIDAVRAAIKPASYPDRWNGPAAYQSDIYPDHWRADRRREQKGVTQAYQDGIRSPCVPAFIVSARQLIENINSVSRGKCAAPTPATGTNNVALGPRGSKKRNPDVIDLVSSSPKRAKTELPSRPNIIDLTQEDVTTTTKFVPTNLPLRPALTEITNLGPNTKSSLKRRKKKTRCSERKQDIHGESIGTLAKIASKLRASAHGLDLDRAALRQRWEVDEKLQLQHVTDRLAELNDYFTATENGIRAALEVIEKDLLL